MSTRIRLSWRSPYMSAPSFWYFDCETDAIAAAARLQPLTEWSISRGRSTYIIGVA
jgi:hypothetical protein